MPSFAGKLSNAEIRDVAKFVAVVTRDPQDSADSDDSDDLAPPP
jgi:mono/diheme cytochrome c family protein